MKKCRILMIDDNQDLLDAWQMVLEPQLGIVETIKDPERIPDRLARTSYDLILLDMNFKASVNTGNEGLFWLKKIAELVPDQGVVVITAYGDIQLAVKAMKLGAVDFIQKNWEVDKVLSIVKTACQHQQTRKELVQLKNKEKHLRESMEAGYRLIRGRSKSMEVIYRQIEKVAPTEANILILGENGTGKELIAREIKNQSKRRHEIFVSVDLGSITGSLFESELFGHVKGAFTGADTDKPGRIELASGGTLFLDEIGNLSPDMQSKLLSVMQNREVIRVGSLKRTEVDFRLISATNQDLRDAITNGRFREDLFYRINTITLHLPPLRERLEDLPVLADHFVHHYCEKYGKNVKLSSASYKAMQQHHWPGNVRELRHVIEKGIILAEESTIHINDLTVFTPGKSPAVGEEDLDLGMHEQNLIRKALFKSKGNRSLAAKLLGINRSTLYEKIKKWSIHPF